MGCGGFEFDAGLREAFLGGLQLGRSAVYDLIRTRQLASITLGRARRIPTHALNGFIRTRLDQEAAA
ncbi:DNA-binding protein [Streptomyces sp. CWNU-52B]|uniref:DNA-binding protein n=1 Tax=unclassified Streptomyces TaxID=2593676 RepID=UPI0039C02A85